MAEVLTVMAVATFIKDAMEVWDKIENSFARLSKNRRGVQRLVREIRNDLILLKDLYDEHHTTLDKSTRTETAIRTLIENMEQALGTCSQLLPPVSEKRFDKYTLKYYAWKNGSKIEEGLLYLKSHVNECRQRFNTLAMARVEIGAIEHHQVHVNRTNIMQNMLSDLTVSANRLRAYHPVQSGISPSIIIDIPNEYLKLILSSISQALYTKESVYAYLFVELSWPTIQGSDNDLFPHDRESLHRDTVAFALYIHRVIENPVADFQIQLPIIRLTRMARRLGMSREADSIDYLTVFTQTVTDQSRPQMRSLVHAADKSMGPSLKSEVLQHLDVFEHQVDLIFRFYEHQFEATDASDAFLAQIANVYHDIFFFYFLNGDIIPEVEKIQEEIERLRRNVRRIHKPD